MKKKTQKALENGRNGDHGDENSFKKYNFENVICGNQNSHSWGYLNTAIAFFFVTLKQEVFEFY